MRSGKNDSGRKQSRREAAKISKIIPFDYTVLSCYPRGKFNHGTFVHNSVQSMCFDRRNRRYVVGFAMPNNVSALVRMKDLSFEYDAIEKSVTGLPLAHCNDLVYCAGEHKIYAVGGEYWVAVVDPDTLQVERKIPVSMMAWSLALYPNGDFFVHDGGRGERFIHDFSSSQTISVNDREIIIEDLQVPYRPKRGDYAGVWQGAIVIDGMPYMIFNEFSLKTGEPISFVLFSCEMGRDRTIYRAKTDHEVESADFVDGLMKVAYNNTYRYGGGEWEMSEIYTKTLYIEKRAVELPAGKETAIDLKGDIPKDYLLTAANVNFKKNGTSWRTLPYMNNAGKCVLKVLKIQSNKVYLKSEEAFSNNDLQITAICRKKA